MKKRPSSSKKTERSGKARAEKVRVSARRKNSGAKHGDPSFRPLTLERRKTPGNAPEAEAQMQELELLAQSLMQAQESQQQTISRELHDNIAQVLTAVTNRISMASTTSTVPAWLRQELQDLQENLNTALTDVRTLARDLRPSQLDHCGFAATLERHTHDFRKRTGIDLELQLDPQAPGFLGSENLTHLFRLVQEAMQNIEDHANASRAWLTISRNNGTMELEIGDNGCAFTPQRIAEAQRDGHLGLLGMRERAELLGGTFLLESFPGKGTTISVSVPVPPHKNDAEPRL